MRPLSILVVHSELPMPDRHSGSLRLWRLLEGLVGDGHAVTFLARWGFGQEMYAAELAALGIEVLSVDSRRLASAGVVLPGAPFDFVEFMRRGRFDVAWLSFYDVAEQYLPEIRVASPATRIIVDTVDVHWVRERRGAELSGDAEQLRAAERTREREQRIYAQADALVAVTRDDALALAELAPEVPTAVISNVHLETSSGPGFDARSGLVFVGNFDHVPNVDAIVHFHRTFWPEVRRRLPDVELSIVGQTPPSAVQALAGPGVRVTGWVPEVGPYLDSARVSIAPLRFGAGVKGKIGEALSHGLPVVTTATGAEGMGLIHGQHALIGDEQTFADEVCRLHEDRTLWERLAHAGPAHVAQQLSAHTAQSALRALLQETVRHTLVALDPWSDPGRLRAILGSYLSEFEAMSSATLVLPAPATELTLERAGELAARAIADLGANPEEIPDVLVAGSVEAPAIPRSATTIGRRPEPEPVDAGRARAAEAGIRRTGVQASIIVCAYGKRDYSERCLQSLRQALGERLGTSWELVLVDNGSPDSTAELFAQWADTAKVVSLERNRNFAGGNNAGARVAAGEVLIFLNNDTEVPAGALEALVQEAQRPGVGLVGTRLLYPDGRIQHGGFGWRGGARPLAPFHLFHFEDGDLAAARTSYDIGAVTGACMAIPADVFDAVGGFDEGYVNGWEDVDLCWRVRMTGRRVRYRGDVHLIHHEGITSGGSYHGDGNVQRFAARWNRVVTDDHLLVRRTLGAEFSPLADRPAGGVGADGAAVLVSGPLGSLGSAGDEARGLLAALVAGGVDVAARPDAPSWVGPAMSESRWGELLAAHARVAHPEALKLAVGAPKDAEGGPLILRLADPCRTRPDGAFAWAASPALGRELVADGWPADGVIIMPPMGIPALLGGGGRGILVMLPSSPGAVCALLEGLRDVRPDEIRLLPTVRSLELQQLVADRLPAATVLAPTTDERALQRLAGESDLVVALNADDRFDRQALVAAASGAGVVVRPHGPADAVLGALATRAQPDDPEMIRRAINAAPEVPGDRGRRSAAVAAACDPAAVVQALTLTAAPQLSYA